MKKTKSSYEKKEKIWKVVRFQTLKIISTHLSVILMRLDSKLLMRGHRATRCKIDHREPAAAGLRDAGALVEHESRGGAAWHDAFRNQSLFENT